VPYKGNRVDKPKPKHLAFLRSYLVKEWGASISEGEEADDTIAIEATKLGDNCVIVSLDKDLDQIVGWHYNFVKRLGYYITPEEALVKLYTQMITGDAADNIKGLFRVGPVKAAKIIGDTTDELELYNKVLEAYEGDAERVLENAQLLFLRRYEGQVWTPPQA
jgi:5'-3' exonuclease